MSGRIDEQSSRHLHLDNVLPEHRVAISQLTNDVLMEIRVAQFTRKPLSEDRVTAILNDVQQRRPDVDIGALKIALLKTMATPYGRPGFRQALQQKRAFLDMIPLSLRHVILKTPILVMPENAFLSYVRGSGSENAVTLIVNGEPVVLMREGANHRSLVEEGIHVMQIRDPNYHDKTASLDETRMARWHEMSLEEQVAAYRNKIDVEIDGHETLIHNLERRAKRAWWPRSKKQAEMELAQARYSLVKLQDQSAKAETYDASLDTDFESSSKNRPTWLERPARLFSDDDNQLIVRHLPKARMPVRTAYFKLVKHFKGMSKSERRRLLNTLRIMKGAVGIDQVVESMEHLMRRSPDDLSADKVTDAVQEYFLTLRYPQKPSSFSDRIKNKNFTLDDLPDELRIAWEQHIKTSNANSETSSDIKDESTKQTPEDLTLRQIETKELTLDEFVNHFIKSTLDQLQLSDSANAGTNPDFMIAKRAAFLALENSAKNRGNKHILEQVKMIAITLGVPPLNDVLPELNGKPSVQAHILESLATNNYMLKNSTPPPHKTYFDAVKKLIAAGATDLPETGRHFIFEFLAQTYYSNGTQEHFDKIVDLMTAIRSIHPTSREQQQTQLNAALDFLSRQSINLSKIEKVERLFRHAVLLPGDDPDKIKGKVTYQEMSAYFEEALSSTDFAQSLIRIGHRVDSDRPLSEDEVKSIRKGKRLTATRSTFLERFKKESNDTHPLLSGTREEHAVELQEQFKRHSAPGQELTLQEARSIAQRLEVLTHSQVFGDLIGNSGDSTSLDDFMQSISKSISAIGLNDLNAVNDQNTRGVIIEDEFRKFVRDQAKQMVVNLVTGELPSEITDHFADFPVEVRSQMLSEMRVALVNYFIRGNRPDSEQNLSTPVRAALDSFRNKLVSAHRSEGEAEPLLPDSDPTSSAKSVRSTLDSGVATIEKRAKGSMFEHLVETLLDQETSDGNSQRYNDVESLTDSRSDLLSFRSDDQDAATNQPRKYDHLIKVLTDNPPPGMKKGHKIAVDSKNGEGAFSKDQFRRYFVEMMKGIKGDDSNFVQGELEGLLYLCNSKENSAKAYKEVTQLIAEMFDGSEISGEIRVKISNTETFTISRDLLLANAKELNIFFGRISQSPGSGGKGTALGPFMIDSHKQSIADFISTELGSGNSQTNSTAESEKNSNGDA